MPPARNWIPGASGREMPGLSENTPLAWLWSLMVRQRKYRSAAWLVLQLLRAEYTSWGEIWNHWCLPATLQNSWDVEKQGLFLERPLQLETRAPYATPENAYPSLPDPCQWWCRQRTVHQNWKGGRTGRGQKKSQTGVAMPCAFRGPASRQKCLFCSSHSPHPQGKGSQVEFSFFFSFVFSF